MSVVRPQCWGARGQHFSYYTVWLGRVLLLPAAGLLVVLLRSAINVRRGRRSSILSDAGTLVYYVYPTGLECFRT